MTDAGEKWACGQCKKMDKSDPFSRAVISKDAEFWIRAFCVEVEKRVEERRDELVVPATFRAFQELKRELLG